MLGLTAVWQGRRWLQSRLLQVFSVALALGVWLSPVSAADDFLDPEQAFQLSVAMHSPTQVDVHFTIAPKYYMYQSRFAFALNGDENAVGEPLYPPAKIIYDPNFNEDMAVYRQQVTLRVPVQPGLGVPGLPLSFNLTYQGCADAGLCYSPITDTVQLVPTKDGYKAQGQWVADRVPEPLDYVVEEGEQGKDGVAAAGEATEAVSFSQVFSLSDRGIAGFLSEASWMEMMALAFVLGLLLSFTPCVLPMVPILLSIIAGNAGREGAKAVGSSQQQKKSDSPRNRGLLLAAVYVLGMSLVYTALGVAAGLAGASLAAWLQTPLILSVFAVILALLALSMFDVYSLQAPAGMQSALQGRLAKIPGGRYSGVFVMGMGSALIVGPCVAAPLAGVLLFISQTGDVILGGATLFALAWGSGTLLLVVGASSGAMLPKAGAWMNNVKYGFGVLLLATAWWMVNSVLPSWIFMLGWAVLAMWSAVLLGAFSWSTSGAGTSRGAGAGTGAGAGAQLLKAVGLLVAVWAVALIVGVASGGRSVLQPLAGIGFGYGNGASIGMSGGGGGAGFGAGEASGFGGVAGVVKAPPFQKVASIAELDAALAVTDRPVMLDFYADWCVSCIEMEKFTFTHPQVAQKMGTMLLLQADVTANTPEDRALLKRFQLFGPPGIIFFNAAGTELNEPRVIGFMKASDFSERLDQVLGQRH